MAKMTDKMARDITREEYVVQLMQYFNELDEEVLQTKSNEFCFPCVDKAGNEQFLRVTVSIPTGSKDDPYDGYSEAESYQIKMKEKAQKAKESQEKKAAKKARDEARREKQKLIHEKQNA